MSDRSGSRFSELFAYDGSFYSMMGKACDVMIASIYWIIGCIPIISIGASCAALYRTCSEAIRGDRGTVTSVFWHSYSQNFRQGFYLELLTGGGLFLMLWNIGIVMHKMSGNIEVACLLFYGLLFAFVLAASMYCYPALSRFGGEVGWFVKLSMYLVIRHLPTSLALLALFAACYLGIFVCIPAIIILPGVLALVSTYLIDPILDQHMPVTEE